MMQIYKCKNKFKSYLEVQDYIKTLNQKSNILEFFQYKENNNIKLLLFSFISNEEVLIISRYDLMFYLDKVMHLINERDELIKYEIEDSIFLSILKYYNYNDFLLCQTDENVYKGFYNFKNIIFIDMKNNSIKLFEKEIKAKNSKKLLALFQKEVEINILNNDIDLGINLLNIIIKLFNE